MHTETEFRNKITLLSFLMALLIVVRHAVNYEIYGLVSGCLYWVQRYLRVFTDLMVPSFFAISGYLFFRNYAPEKLIGKWKSRAFSLLVPYIIWNLTAYLFYQIILFVPGVSASMNQVDAVFSLSAMFDAILWSRRNVTWFIRFLIGFCLAAPVAWYFIRKRVIGAVVLVLLIAAGTILDFKFLSYLAIFLFGGWIGINRADKVMVKYSLRVRCLAVWLLCGTVLAETLCSSTSGGGGEFVLQMDSDLLNLGVG